MNEASGSDRYAVGVEAVDEDHKKLFAAMGELESAIARQADLAEALVLLKKLSTATGEHFAGEETMMSEAKYPGLALHRANHQRLMEKLEAFVARYSRGGVQMNQHALTFLRDWLVYHIENDDQRLGAWLKDRARELARAHEQPQVAASAG